MDLILTNWEELVDEVKTVRSSNHVIFEFTVLGKGKAVCSQIYRSD